MTGMYLSNYDLAAALGNAVDGDVLKAELTRLGLKFGGTIAKHVPLDKLPKKLFVKNKLPSSSSHVSATTIPDPVVS